MTVHVYNRNLEFLQENRTLFQKWYIPARATKYKDRKFQNQVKNVEAIDIQLAYNSIENQSSLNNFLLNGSTVCLLPLNGSLASTGGKYDIVLTKMWKPFWLLMVTAAGKNMLFQ